MAGNRAVGDFSSIHQPTIYVYTILHLLLLQCLWSVVAAILHLGNLEFRGNGGTPASFQDEEQARTVAKVYTIEHPVKS